jgi:hypothetical protein
MNQYIHYFVNGRHVTIPAEYAHLIRMKMRKEVAAEYGITIKVLRERLCTLRVRLSSKNILPISDVIEIYLALGWPINGKSD